MHCVDYTDDTVLCTRVRVRVRVRARVYARACARACVRVRLLVYTAVIVEALLYKMCISRMFGVVPCIKRAVCPGCAG